MLILAVLALLQSVLAKYLLLNCCFELSTVLHILTALLAILTPLVYRIAGLSNGTGSKLSVTTQEDWRVTQGYIA
jgi:hypothetical protein